MRGHRLTTLRVAMATDSLVTQGSVVGKNGPASCRLIESRSHGIEVLVFSGNCNMDWLMSCTAACPALPSIHVQALLDMTNTGALQLPWAHRFCLLHACLVDRNSDRGRWAWLPSASYSLCSSALQDLTRANDAKENNANLAINRVRHGTAQQGAAQREGGLRQGRERGTRPGLTAPRAVTVSRSALLRGGVGVGVDVGVEGVPPSVIARVCSAMARIGDASSAEGGTDVLSSKPGLLSNCDIPPRAGDLFEKGGDWLNSFRFKVRTLQEAIMGSAEGVGAGDQQCPLGEPRAPDEPSKEVGEVRFETVVRALRKSGYADSLILSIKVRLRSLQAL